MTNPVTTHSPSGPCVSPLFAGVLRTRANQPLPSVSGPRQSWRTTMSKSKGELVSVKIIPERARHSRREACRCGGGLRSRSRPAQRDETDWLRSVGTSRWREKRDVSGPAVLRERGTPELRTAATRQRGAECAGGNQAVHPRRVHPRPGSRLIGQRSPRRCGLSPAAWGHRLLVDGLRS